MGESVGNIAIVVGADVADFISDMGKAAVAVKGFDEKTRELVSTIAKYGAASLAAGAAVVTGLYASASDTIDRQAKLARAVGSTTASIQSLEFAADLAGISHEEMAQASGKLNRKLGEAITVGGSAAAELERLGLSAKSLASMDANDRLAVIADRLVALGYNSAQAGAALKELGLKGNEMVAMMMDGGQQFRDASQALKDFNVLVSDVDAAKIEAANDAWTNVHFALKGVANTLAVELSPYVQVVADYLREASVASGGFKTQVHDAVQMGLSGFAKVADILQGLRVVFKGLELVAVSFGAAVFSVLEGLATLNANILDSFVVGINLAITASNKLLDTSQELLSLPSDSAFMDGLHRMGDTARDKVSELRSELQDLALQPMPSDQVARFLDDVARKATETSQATVNARKRMTTLPEENEETKKKHQTSESILEGLRAGTQAMQSELKKRESILDIYRSNQLAADAPYYAQQLAEIALNEQQKQAELLASHEKDAAQRAEQRAKNLERVAGDQQAIAAIKAEYDVQTALAEQSQQDQLTQIQEEAQAARAKLRQLEMDHALSVALGLGQQLMQVTQGHSQRAFEFSKKAALASAVIDGYQSATAAWRAGMATGGPWAPAVAAAYTASSLLKTGALIQSIRSTSFSGGSASSSAASAGGGSAGSVPTSGGNGGAASANSGSVMHVQGLDPNHLFTGSALQTIAKGLLNFQKDGGKVVFDA